MTKSDVLLEEDRIIVVGNSENDASEAALEVAASEDEDPDIRLNPDWANISAGGGDGEASEGDLFLLDRDERPTVHISAEGGNIGGVEEHPWDGGDPNVWINGEKGRIKLGNPGKGEPGISMDWDSESISVFSSSGGYIDLNGRGDAATISIWDEGAGEEVIELDGSAGSVGVGHYTHGPKSSLFQEVDQEFIAGNMEVSKSPSGPGGNIWLSEESPDYDPERVKASTGLRLGTWATQGALLMTFGENVDNDPGVILADGWFWLGNEERPGRVVIEGNKGDTVAIDGNHGLLTLGNEDTRKAGLEILGGSGDTTVEIKGGSSGDIDTNPIFNIGGNGGDGHIKVTGINGRTGTNIESGNITIGGDGRDGTLVLQPSDETNFRYQILATERRAGGSPSDNGLIFRVNNNIPLRISPDGDVFINGQKVDPSNL